MLILSVFCNHFMICVENVADKATRELFPEALDIGRRISDACESRGVLVRPIGHLNILSPPLILTREEIDKIVATLHESINAVMVDLENEGHWKR